MYHFFNCRRGKAFPVQGKVECHVTAAGLTDLPVSVREEGNIDRRIAGQQGFKLFGKHGAGSGEGRKIDGQGPVFASFPDWEGDIAAGSADRTGQFAVDIAC